MLWEYLQSRIIMGKKLRVLLLLVLFLSVHAYAIEQGSGLFQTEYKGGWEVVSPNAGVSAMHLVLLPPTNKAVMFDSTSRGPSRLPLTRAIGCRMFNGTMDCWAHALEFDIETAAIRPLKLETDTWCSSGGLNADGVLVQSGGENEGGRAVRYLQRCDNCNWTEYPNALSGRRWYATQQILADGSFIVVGGRGMLNYEFIPASGKTNVNNFQLPLLKETTDPLLESENNLYPHVHLSTDGNLFILANYRAILLDPKFNRVLRQYPDLPGGARNYPGSASSAVLPLHLGDYTNRSIIPAEILVCGGAPKWAFRLVRRKKMFVPALQTCGRIELTAADAAWKIEQMPAPRVMADMLILPTADLLMINGAKNGSSGWECADNPYFNPVLYRLSKGNNTRFEELEPSSIPRMYHSSSAVLPDGKILVAGSNPNSKYRFGPPAKYPTELRVEKFSPPYLDPNLAPHRPSIPSRFDNRKLKYGEEFDLDIVLNDAVVISTELMVTMYSPPFTTHGYSMSQRMLILAKTNVSVPTVGTYRISVTAPSNGAEAPPGYYMLFAVHRGLPSKAVWVKLSNK